MASYKQLYRRFIDEVMVGGNLEVIDDLVGEKFVEHEEGLPGLPEGREGLRATMQAMLEGFSDIGVSIEDMVEDGDTIWARLRLRGTHTGDFMGVPATGKPFEIGAIDVVRFQDGKAVEHWGVTDLAALLMQIGVLTPPAA